MSSDYLDTVEAGAYIGVPAETLKGWRSRGMGPRYRKLPNGKVRYRRDWLDDFSDAHVVEPGSNELA